MNIKTQYLDNEGKVISTEYYAKGEYEAVLKAEATSQKEARNAAIKAQRNAAMADPVTGSDGMYLYAVFTGKPEDMDKWRAHRQKIIDAYPDEVE